MMTIDRLFFKPFSVLDSYCCPQVCQPTTQWITAKIPGDLTEIKIRVQKSDTSSNFRRNNSTTLQFYITELLYKYYIVCVWFIYNKIIKNHVEYFPGLKLKVLRAETKQSYQDKSIN